jgi:hypothetical protein
MQKNCFAFIVTFFLVAIVHTAGCGSREIPANLDSQEILTDFDAQNIPSEFDNGEIPAEFDYGNWTDSTYQNDFFGFSITVPESWHITGKEEMAAAFQKVPEMDYAEDYVDTDEMKEMSKVYDRLVAGLFTAKPYKTSEEAMANGSINPTISMSAENLSTLMITTREQYMELAREAIVKITHNTVIKSETNITIGGMEFTSLKMELNVDGVGCIHTETLFYLKNGYVLTISLVWVFDFEKEQLDDIMATLQWK